MVISMFRLTEVSVFVFVYYLRKRAIFGIAAALIALMVAAMVKSLSPVAKAGQPHGEICRPALERDIDARSDASSLPGAGVPAP